jgi:hypothetical protein
MAPQPYPPWYQWSAMNTLLNHLYKQIEGYFDPVEPRFTNVMYRELNWKPQKGIKHVDGRYQRPLFWHLLTKFHITWHNNYFRKKENCNLCKFKEPNPQNTEVGLITSLMLSTGLPSNSTTTSPGANPARSAGHPGVTWLPSHLVLALPNCYQNHCMLKHITAEKPHFKIRTGRKQQGYKGKKGCGLW